MKNIVLCVMVLFVFASTLALSQGKLSGNMIGDYYYNVLRDTSFNGTAPANAASASSAPGAKAMQAFQLRRIYFAYDNDLSDQFTTRFRLEADQAALTSNGKIGTFVKDAYLKWKNVFSGSDLIFGIQPTPAYEISEAAWGYRSLEKTLMDLRGIVSSRDQGISLKGRLAGEGAVNYWVMFANNSGNSPETDKYKRYYAHVQFKPSANFQATLYADYRDRAKIAAGDNGTWTTAAFAGLSEPFVYSLGVEAYLTSQAHAFTPVGGTLGSRNGVGISVFGSYSLMPELAAVARYDFFDPNTNGAANAKGDACHYVVAGLSWKADKNVSVMPNLLYESYEAPAGQQGADASVTARLTMYYVFL